MAAVERIVLMVLALWFHAGFAQAQITVGQTGSLHSTILDEDRGYRVSLPASYRWAEDRRYPVLFVLDGETHFLHTAACVDFLSAQEEIPECIVVAITSTVRIRDFTQTDWPSHWIGGGGAKNFREFLSRELIPRIERDFRTNGFRILSGHSAGGQFVLYALSSEPALFDAYIALSPSLDWDDRLPRRALEESLRRTDSLHAFLYFAWSDDYDQALADDLDVVATLEAHAPRGFRWVGKGYPEETHGSIPLLAQIDALRRLFAGFRYPGDLLPKGFAFAEKHFQEVSRTVGYDIPVPEAVINAFGYDALDRGDVEEAIALFKKNIDQNPNSANAFDSIADAYEQAGKWDEAKAAIARAVELAARYDHPNRDDFIRHREKLRTRSEAESAK
ncbi:MAG: tetratricopeptide repeat protein [Bacteroidetes bacterium]|nr:tetratricopeptide repeat protein [Bacteroidota bacterium]